MDDIIKKVKYSHTKDVVLVELKKSNFTVEFRNGKKNRAEIVKKMKLNKGEPVIIVGAKVMSVISMYLDGISKGKDLLIQAHIPLSVELWKKLQESVRIKYFM